MNAIEFVKKFGIYEAKRIVEYRDNHAKSTHVFKFNKSCVDKGVINGGAYLYTKSYNDYSVSVGDLKQIVDAFEFVDAHRSIDIAKKYISTMDAGGTSKHYDKLRTFINLVEQCQND